MNDIEWQVYNAYCCLDYRKQKQEKIAEIYEERVDKYLKRKGAESLSKREIFKRAAAMLKNRKGFSEEPDIEWL